MQHSPLTCQEVGRMIWALRGAPAIPFRGLWGNDYHQTANDNIMLVAMIESPAGVAPIEGEND